MRVVRPWSARLTHHRFLESYEVWPEIAEAVYENPELGVPSGSSTVEVTLEPDGEDTLLRLVHHDLPGPERASFVGGWGKMLARLAAAASSGHPDS